MLRPISAKYFDQEIFSVRQKEFLVQHRAGTEGEDTSRLRPWVLSSGGAVAKW
jgi:hypothetical protein